jgi:hypothetical protein
MFRATRGQGPARPTPRGRGGERGESGGIRFRRREMQYPGGPRLRGLPRGAGRIGHRRRPAGTRRAWNFRSEMASAEFIRGVVPRGFAWRCPVGRRGDAPGAGRGGRETGKTSGGRPAKWGAHRIRSPKPPKLAFLGQGTELHQEGPFSAVPAQRCPRVG